MVPTNPHRSSEGEGLTERIHWPEEYQISWQIDIPYIKELQKDGLTYQYQGWQDTKHGRQKTTRDGVESVIEFLDNNTMYNIYPRIDAWGCRTLEIAGGKGPTRRLLGDDRPELTLVLPDLNEGRWQYNFTGPVPDGMHKGVEAYAYSYSVVTDEGNGETTATYTFYIGTADITPLRLYMWGKNLFTGGHYDAYIVDYYGYTPGPAPAEVWSVPDYCPKHLSPDNEDHASRFSHWLTKLRSVLPSTHFGDMAYDAFTHAFGRRHASRGEYSSRMQHFRGNKAMIEQHNSGANATTHKLGVNIFADWSHEEFLAIMLPNRGQPRPPLWPEGAEQNVHKREVPQHKLPRKVDWRGTGYDSPVKDQAMCGSCWAFGAVGSLEAAYWRETGKQMLLSEQELIDCAWDPKDDNKGCMGGFQTLAYKWLLPRGEVASEAAYPYKGVTDFCKSNVTSGARFRKAKYVEVKGGEEVLMEALLTKGPMTVSVDAGPKSFAFYHSGVYTEPTCNTKIDKLDHAVIVSGYGTTKEGKDYWLVKNTWSSMWGDEGYLKISRKPDDCGIATQPIYIDFEVNE